MADTTIVTSESELKTAISSGLTPIIIADDIILTSMTNVNYEIEIQGDGSVSLIWGGTAITNRNMFNVQSAGFLKIENLILDGGEKDVTLINIIGGQGSMDEGSILRNLKSTSANCAVKLNGGTFTMDGGLVTDIDTSEAILCTSGNLIMQKDAQIVNTIGAGLSLYRGDLKMSDQSRIAENKSKQPGGGILSAYSTITMGLKEGDSPAVENNESPSYSGAIYLANGSILTMHYDSRISGNKAVTFASGIGMGQSSQLLMYENSSISENESPAGSGAWANDSTIKMFDFSAISGNISSGVGGGVYLQDGTNFEMYGASTVKENSGTNGGGIYIKNSTAAIGINEGDAPQITDNVASGNGGGIFIDENSTLSLSRNVIISGNEAIEGVGIYKDGILNLSGSPKIYDFFFDDLTIQSGNIKSRVTSDNVPIIVDALTPDATIQLEESTYMSPENVPLVIAEKGASYAQLTQTDSDAFVIPISFGAGYYTTLNETNDQILIDAETYNITYNDLFGATNPNPKTYTVQDLPITLLDPGERCDYTFLGWFDEGAAQIAQIAQGTTGDISITANWQDPLSEHILTYDSNAPDVTDMPASIVAEEGTSLLVTAEVPLRNNYSFTLWNTASDGSGDSYQAGDSLLISYSDIRLYAQWEEEAGTVYTLGFTGNALDATNVPESINSFMSDLITISNEIPLRNNYSFLNWNTSADGSGDYYNPGDTLIMPSSDFFLYALWEESHHLIHTIIFDGNASDATDVPASIFADAGTSVSIPIATPEREDYVFTQWNTASDASGDSYQPGNTIMLDLDLTLYAIWQLVPRILRSINFNGNAADVTNIPETILVNGRELVTLPKTIPVKNSYSFTGWNTSSAGNGTSYIPGLTITMPDNDLTLYAQWIIAPKAMNTLVFNGNSSNVSNLPQSITALIRSNIIIPRTVPTKAGYLFLNWNTSANGTGTTYLPGQNYVMPNSIQGLYAQWKVAQRKTYFITFDGNEIGVSNIPTPIAVTEGNTITLPLDVPKRSTRANYYFSSWNTSPNGNGITYFPGQTITMPASHMTLYAKWNTGWVHISFVRNDFSDSTTCWIPRNRKIAIGRGLRVPRSVPTRCGYTFMGWRAMFEGQVNIFNPNDWVGYVKENMTFIAQWSKNRDGKNKNS